MAYLQATLGGIVRVTGSGEGCRGWPLCGGHFYPAADIHSFIEFSHRTNGTLLGLAVLATFVLVLARFRHDRHLLVLASVALGLVAFEGAVGGTVVFADLQGFLVLFHFGMALVIVAVLLALTFRAFGRGTGIPDANFTRLVTVATVLTYVLLLTGSSVVATSADEKCLAWPLCGNGFGIDLGGVVALNYLHRGAVLLVGVLILHVSTSAVRRWRDVPAVGPAGALAAGLFVLQVIDGALLAVTHEVGIFNAAHVALATGVWAALVSLTLAARQRVERQPAGSRLSLQGEPT